MERDKLDLGYFRKILIVFVVLVLACTWLAEYFFDEEYTDSIYTYFEFWLYIIGPIIIGFLIYVVNYSRHKDKAHEKAERVEVIKNFKTHARIINVNFEDCDITHHEYEKEIILRKDTRYQERKIVRFSECQVKYSLLENDLPVVYKTPTLYMELIDLRYKLYQKKETTIYVDHKGENRFVDKNGMSYFTNEAENPFYYFDIEFLGESVRNRPTAD